MSEVALPKLGEYFSIRKERGEVGLPTLSVTMNDGLVNRENLDRRTESGLRPEQHLRIVKGDIAYNMMRMWQGAFGRADYDGIVSPAYVVLKPRKGIDTRFATHWFKSARMIHLFWAYSYGLTEDRLRLYADDFCEIPAAPPPLIEQRRIANVLDAWDSAIATTEALILAKRQCFEGLLADTIAHHQRTSSRHDRWSRSELSSLVRFVSGGTPNRAIGLFWSGAVPWITAKDLKTFDISSSLDTLTEEGAAKVNVVPAGTTLLLVRGMGLFKDIPLGIASRPVAFNQDIKALRPKSDLEPRFLAYALRSRRTAMMDRVDRAGHGTGRLATELIEALPIAFPSRKEQRDIINTLDAANSDVLLTECVLAHLRAQKHGLMQRLLSAEWRLGGEETPAKALERAAS